PALRLRLPLPQQPQARPHHPLPVHDRPHAPRLRHPSPGVGGATGVRMGEGDLLEPAPTRDLAGLRPARFDHGPLPEVRSHRIQRVVQGGILQFRAEDEEPPRGDAPLADGRSEPGAERGIGIGDEPPGTARLQPRRGLRLPPEDRFRLRPPRGPGREGTRPTRRAAQGRLRGLRSAPGRHGVSKGRRGRGSRRRGEVPMSAVDAPGRALTAERSFDRTSVAAVSASLGAMLVLLAWGTLHDSPTVDEPNHIVRGMALGRTGDARLSFAHPPLANGLQALPVIVLGTSLPIEELEGWEEWAIETTVDSAAAHDYAAFRSAIVQGRFVTMALTIALGLYLFFFVREFFGVVAARFAIVIYALHPVFLAHGRLVTTDLPVTLGTLLFTGELVRYLGSRRRLHLFTLGLSLAFACTVKFSGLFLVPPFAFAMAWAALRGSGRFPRELPRGRRLRLCARDFAIVGLITWAAVNASYGFERTGM